MTREEKRGELIVMFCTGTMYIGDIIDEAMDFAVDKACEWLEENLARETSIIASGTANINFENAIIQFKQAMEE